MAYIVPDAIVELFGDISLDANYENSLYFASTAEKDTYFTNLYSTKGVGRSTQLSYNREQRGYVRLGMTRATAINATYMRFKNTSFENKWFYAFVKNAEYINNGVTEIQFELDYVMTWQGAFTLGQCYIERQHTLNDGIGNNIADEGLPTGGYIVEDTISMEDLDQPFPYAIAIVYADETVSGSYLSKIYSGCKVEFFYTRISADAFLQTMTDNNLIDNIVGIYMIPKSYAESAEASASGDVLTHRVEIDKPYDNISGYVPKNNKLFCYPYKFIEVDNGRGSSHRYSYEYFNAVPDIASTGKCNFQLYISISSNCEVMCVPISYKTYNPFTSESIYNWQNRIGAGNYPECSFAIDSYRAYRAQVNSSLNYKLDQADYAMNKGSEIWGGTNTERGSILNKAIGGIGGLIATSKAIFGGGSTLTSGGAMVDTILQANLVNNAEKQQPDIVRGEATPNAMWGVSELKFIAYRKSITKNYAMMIDDFFTMFGYAVRQVGVPNMNARPHFTYVKTLGSVVHGNMPSDHARSIENVFDKGIRFWKNIDEIGNYDLDNSPA